MIRKNNNSKMKGFTLVELLAVIVILAIILVIAVPKIMDIINDAKKATLESTAKMIASAAEKQKVQNTVLGKTDDISCDSVAKINDVDYEDCDIDFDENTAKVTIKGSGKFAGLYVCNGTKTGAEASNDECKVNTLVTHIQDLYVNETTRTFNGLTKDNTTDENIRYSGSNDLVKNYVEFGNINEVWRIIGVFKVKTADGYTEELVKIVRETSIGEIKWNTSEVNQWGPSENYEGASLMKILNEKYLNKENVENSCLNGLTYEICNFSTIGMDSTYKNMIENIVWNTNIIDFDDSDIIVNNDNINTLNLYNAERANGIEPNPYIWTGLVALPYATDWGYASSESDCNTNLRASSNGYDYNNAIFYGGTCKNNNWMHFLVSDYSSMGFLSPVSEVIGNRVENDCSIVVDGQGYIGSSLVSNSSRIHPTIYLKSNIQIKDGDGSKNNPYKLAM